MTNYERLFIIAVVILSASSAQAIDWIAAPSRFTHDPRSGQRVWQFASPPTVYHDPPLSRSVYRQSRSSLQVGDSADHYHVVDRYGEEVRPYGEWRFPYRPFSVPYSEWGPQPGGGFGPAYGFGGGFGAGGAGGVGSPYGPYGAVNGSGFPPPWNDGSYPDVRRQQTAPQALPVPGFNLNNTVNGNDNNVNVNGQ